MKLNSLCCYVLTLISLTSCNSVQDDGNDRYFKFTENEDKGIKKILQYYGGNCEYGFEKEIGENNKPTTTFWISLGKTKALDTLSRFAELVASNICFQFYNELKEEKTLFDSLRSELIFGDDTKLSFSYSLSQLNIVNSKISIVNKVSELIKSKHFDSLNNYIVVDTSLFNFNKQDFISELKIFENHNSTIQGIIPYGFKFYKSKNGKDLLRITSLMKRVDNINYFSVVLDPNSNEEYIYTMNYGL